MQHAVTKPSRWYYAIGAAVVILGFVGAACYGSVHAKEAVPDIRVVAPGTHELQLDAVGKYTVFYEYKSVVDGQTYSTGESLPAISIGLLTKDTSQPVELVRPSGKSSYRVNEYSGMSVLEFSIDEAGTYLFTSRYDEGRTGPDVIFAIGKNNVGRIVAAFLGMALGGLVAGVLIVIITFVRRRIANTRMKAVSTSDTGGS